MIAILVYFIGPEYFCFKKTAQYKIFMKHDRY